MGSSLSPLLLLRSKMADPVREMLIEFSSTLRLSLCLQEKEWTIFSGQPSLISFASNQSIIFCKVSTLVGPVDSSKKHSGLDSPDSDYECPRSILSKVSNTLDNDY